MGHSRPLFLYFRLFNTQLTVNKCSIIFCRWLDLNRAPLESKATALPTEPHNHCPWHIFLAIGENFHFSKWPNIGEIFFTSGHTVDDEHGEAKGKNHLEWVSLLRSSASVTRWLRYFSTFGHLHERKFAQWHTKLAKVVPKFCQVVNKFP